MKIKLPSYCVPKPYYKYNPNPACEHFWEIKEFEEYVQVKCTKCPCTLEFEVYE